MRRRVIGLSCMYVSVYVYTYIQHKHRHTQYIYGGEGGREIISQSVLVSVACVSAKFRFTLPIQTTPEQEKPAFSARQLLPKTRLKTYSPDRGGQRVQNTIDPEY